MKHFEKTNSKSKNTKVNGINLEEFRWHMQADGAYVREQEKYAK